MSEPTLVVEPGELAGAEVVVEGDAYRHLFRSRRLAVGERLRVVDGHGEARWGVIQAVDGRRGTVHLGEAAPVCEPSRALEFFVALPRPERAAWLVEKLTELGIHRICWVRSERAVRESGKGMLERHRRIAVAALEQCGGARLPVLEGPHSWEVALDEGAPRSVVLDPSGGTGLSAAGIERAWIGPEGGFTVAERSELLSRGSIPFSLGPRILRIETAAVAAAVRLLSP